MHAKETPLRKALLDARYEISRAFAFELGVPGDSFMGPLSTGNTRIKHWAQSQEFVGDFSNMRFQTLIDSSS